MAPDPPSRFAREESSPAEWSAIRSRVVRLALIAVVAALTQGCSNPFAGLLNPSFPLTNSQAAVALEEMQDARRPAPRPVIVLAGFQDPGIYAQNLARRLRRTVSNPEQIMTISFIAIRSFDDCRDMVIRRVDAAFPTTDKEFTSEVDVIGVSMGGLVARHAARADGARRLRINRLFTISTPHMGAKLASMPTIDQRQIDMRPDSEFLAALQADPTSSSFEIIPYVRLGDGIVGVENTAPHGRVSWWVPTPRNQFAHLGAVTDARILADIARRIRGEVPFTIDPPHPPPAEASRGNEQ